MRVTGGAVLVPVGTTMIVGLLLRSVRAEAAEVATSLSGDHLVPDATVVADRACDLPVAAEVLWPWIAQLGKGRGGWYFPRWLDAVTPPTRRSLRRIDPGLTDPQVGSDHADWGPGEPVLRVTEVRPGRGIVYHSLRDPARGHAWPADGSAARPEVFAMSWQLVLTPSGDGTRLHLRLRARARTRAFGLLGDVFDGVTVALLFAGLRERVRA